MNGNSGSTCTQNKFKLEADEYITSINWTNISNNYYDGKVIKNISFITKKIEHL